MALLDFSTEGLFGGSGFSLSEKPLFSAGSPSIATGSWATPTTSAGGGTGVWDWVQRGIGVLGQGADAYAQYQASRNTGNQPTTTAPTNYAPVVQASSGGVAVSWPLIAVIGLGGAALYFALKS